MPDLSRLPGQAPVAWRGRPGVWAVLAGLAGAAWPPLILTLIFLPPSNLSVGPDMDWRVMALIAGLIAMPAALYLLNRERERSGTPATRLGIIWRFLLYGGLVSAGLQILMTLIMAVYNGANSSALAQGLGAAETTILLYGIAGLPLAMMVGVSYALWAGLCVALIAFAPKAEPMRPRAGLYRPQA